MARCSMLGIDDGTMAARLCLVVDLVKGTNEPTGTSAAVNWFNPVSAKTFTQDLA